RGRRRGRSPPRRRRRLRVTPRLKLFWGQGNTNPSAQGECPAMAPSEIDFEAEGLLDDLEGEAREGRLALLEQLASEGVSLQELREAVAAGRLTLIPVERALAGDGGRYTSREVAKRSGLDL